MIVRKPYQGIVTKVTTSLAYCDLSDYPGYCYFAMLPTGELKIGFSHTAELVRKRMQTLSRAYGAPVIPMLVIKGGWAAEAYLHAKFQHLRLPGDGERFTYGPEIATYIAENRHVGIPIQA